jgi:hypothetical protein
MSRPFVSELRRELVDAAARRERRRLRLPALRLGRRPALALAAAACAAIALAVVALPGGDQQRNQTSAAPGSETPLFGGSLDPNVRYATRVQRPALSLQVDDDGWFVPDASEPSYLELQRVGPRAQSGQEAVVGRLSFLRPAQVYDPNARGSVDAALADVPEDFLGWLRRHPDVRAGRPQPVSVAGLDGMQIDVTIAFSRPALEDPECRRTVGRVCTAIAPFMTPVNGERARIMAFEVDGAPYVIGISAFDQRGLDALLPHAEAVLETLRVR